MLRTRLIAGPSAGFVVSAVTATLLTLANVGETFFEPLRIDPAEPAPVTLRLPPVAMHATDEDGRQRLVRVSPVVTRGETHEPGDVLDYTMLYEASRRPVRPGTLVGLWFVYFLMTVMVTTYMRRFSPSYGGLLRTQVGLLALTVLFMIGSKLTLLYTGISPYILPVGALPLWVALFLDRRTAFMAAIAISFLCASLVDFRLEYLLAYLATSFTMVLALRGRRRAVDVVLSGVAAGVAGATLVMAAELVFSGSMHIAQDLAKLHRSTLLAGFVGGFAPGLLGVAVSGLVGRVLGGVSRARLLDLADLNQPLLQKMANEAPGSWEHARAMANLAEAAVSAIGGDALLTRVGAYYHDLGKTCQAKYFVENLEPGETSPHDGLEPQTSADAIMAHVVEGVRILRDGGIPEPVVEFAYTHHGTSVIEYFWHKYQAAEGPHNLTEDFFRYPGMRPRTKETGILMLIDAIEAASRTIDPPTRENFEEMVNRIVFVKLKQGQMDDCGLSLEDLRVVSSRIIDTLCKSHHTRVRYPWQEAKARGEAAPTVPENRSKSDEESNRAVQEAAEKRAADSTDDPVADSSSSESREPLAS